MQLSFLVPTSRPARTAASLPVIRLGMEELLAIIPENSRGYVLDWFHTNPVQLRISKARSSKFGDYRAPDKHLPARISVNRNLNPYDFLITLIHEMAHHEVWKEATAPQPVSLFHKRRRRPLPHGKEWKNQYRLMMQPMMTDSVFPPDVLHHLEKSFENPRSSSKSNGHLALALRNFDEPDGCVFIESLPFDAVFSLPAGRTFRKGEKLRKRYRCKCLDNGRIYLISPVARVIPSAT
jgi:SprT protein